MNRRRALLLKCAVALLTAAAPALAHAQASCSVSVSPLNFGPYTGAQAQATGTVDLVCSGPPGSRPAYSVTASPGNSNSYAQRHLRRTIAPFDTLNYSLAIQLGATSANWGDGSGGTSAWTGRTQPITGGNPQRAEGTTITGTVPAGAVPSVGIYMDTIVVTATFN